MGQQSPLGYVHLLFFLGAGRVRSHCWSFLYSKKRILNSEHASHVSCSEELTALNTPQAMLCHVFGKTDKKKIHAIYIGPLYLFFTLFNAGVMGVLISA